MIDIGIVRNTLKIIYYVCVYKVYLKYKISFLFQLAEAEQLIEICREYLGGLLLENRRKELPKVCRWREEGYTVLISVLCTVDPR